MFPNANPIKNVWSYIKMLKGKSMYTLKQLLFQIKKMWRFLPTKYTQNLVDSMPKKCKAIIDNGSDWTRY